jgi:hypothetical protein
MLHIGVTMCTYFRPVRPYAIYIVRYFTLACYTWIVVLLCSGLAVRAVMDVVIVLYLCRLVLTTRSFFSAILSSPQIILSVLAECSIRGAVRGCVGCSPSLSCRWLRV